MSLVIVFILSLSTSTLAAEPGSGTIEVQIVNGTAGGSSVADQDVILKTHLNDNETDSITAKADAKGRFTLNGLATDIGYSYQVTVNFQQTEYNSDWVNFGDGETSASTEVTVYDSTTSDEAIRVTKTHTIMYPEEASLRVMEIFFFANESDRTYIGSKEIANVGATETLRLPLPETATELLLEYGLMECCIYGTEDGLIDSVPVLPGNKEVIYSYRVEYNSEAYTFLRKMNYPTDSYNFLVQGESTRVTSDYLIESESIEDSDRLFNHFIGADFLTGDILIAQISGLPQTGNQGAIMWVVLTLVVLAGGFGLNRLLKKQQLRPVLVGGNLTQRKGKLLVELAQLDDDFENGKIHEEVYRRLRDEKKSQLISLMQRSKENSGNK